MSPLFRLTGTFATCIFKIHYTYFTKMCAGTVVPSTRNRNAVRRKRVMLTSQLQ
jgi:hypothetical protein